MSLVWALVTSALAAELLVLSLFLAPLPWGLRKNVARTLRRPRVRAASDTCLRYLCVGLVLAVAESCHALWRLDARLRGLERATASAASGSGGGGAAASAAASDALALHDFRYRRVCGERDLCLAGFCLVIALVLQRLVGLVTNEMSLRDKIKQANGGKKIDEHGNVIVVADKKRD